ncbi:unnamed protein product [Brugia timori]|uniref:Secreted protein n=1 Tax=Brugia timori TaxID=42155 RepID=A0A0R3R7K9_9BILA|nr:unnamed protein product [Brugia timori]
MFLIPRIQSAESFLSLNFLCSIFSLRSIDRLAKRFSKSIINHCIATTNSARTSTEPSKVHFIESLSQRTIVACSIFSDLFLTRHPIA